VSSGSITLSKGTKNGRPRTIHVWEQAQILELQRILPFANEEYGSLVPQGTNLAGFLRRFYRVTRKYNLTRERTMNPHSLRHRGLQRLFKNVTGLPAPIHGHIEPLKQNDPRVRHGFHVVSAAAGHSDRNKSAAYLGSVRAYRNKALVGGSK
jgi:integrase